MPEPYYVDESVTLYHGDCREVVPALGLAVDLIVADPPYGETSLPWDRWPNGWPDAMRTAAKSMWCFGSMRMFLRERDEFLTWRFSQDVIWRKNAGTSFVADRFKRVHETATHWYRGPWAEVHHETPRVVARDAHRRGEIIPRRSANRTPHTGEVGPGDYVYDGMILTPSVIDAKNLRAFAYHPTEKPGAILRPLIEYGCPPGGTVLDPFAGSGSTAEAARLTGRKAVLVEADERYCELIARRMSQGVLMEVAPDA